MKQVKKWLSGFLAAVVVVTSVPLGQVQASEAAVPETQSVAEESGLSQIESITAEDLSFIEYTNGYYAKDWNPETGQPDLEWYRYNLYPTFTVTYKDGHAETGNGGIAVDGQWHSPTYSLENNQSYANQWGVGKHTVTAEIAGKEVTFTVEIVESPIESISVEDMSIIEYTHGYYTTGYNPETGNYDLEWYRYNNYSPTFTVTYKDGRVVTENGSIEINGERCYPSYVDDQTCENQWGVGKHTVTAKFAGKETTFTIEIVESPIESITVEDMSIIEFTNGCFTKDWNPETGQPDLEWYRYDFSQTFTVTYKDGRVVTGNSPVNIDGQWYFPTYETDQSYENQWGVGKHTVTARLGGKETTFTVEIVENPIESITVEDMSITEYTHGYYMKDWNPETGQPDLEWYRYNYSPAFTVTYKDGHIETGNGSINMNGERYYLSYESDQSYENQWGVGKHTVTARIAGKETTFTVEITKSPYVTLEVLKVLPVIENQNCKVDGSGNVIYDIPVFSYKLITKDGSYITEMYDPDYWITDVVQNDGLRVINTQAEKPWTVGGNNSFIIKYGDLEVEVPVELQKASDFEYIEQNGSLYITNCRVSGETVKIPETINGKTVTGIVSLGSAVCLMKNLVIPDTVKSIGAEVFNSWESSIETIVIGSGVTHLDVDMFGCCSKLKSITISEGNPYYCDIDGVVYDKAKETLVYYPIEKGNDYTVPATVKNIDILNAYIYRNINVTFAEGSSVYVTEDGVTYNADKTKVIFCNPSKTGSYMMPDTVTEIAEGAFKESCLTDVKISNNVTEITYEAFANCTSLLNVELPTKLKSIGDWAFCGTSLNEITIPDSVIEIGDSAFDWTPISKLDLGQGVEIIGAGAFCGAEIESLIIPKSVTSIGDGAFSGCENLKKVELKNKNISIGESVFCGCPIEEINLENVKGEIGRWAFERSELTSLNLPDGVTEIAYGAFWNSEELVTIDVPESLVRIDGQSFDNTAWEVAQKDGPVYLEHIFYGYKGNMPDNTDLVIKNGTTVLADFALAQYDELSSVTLPEGLKTIGSATFWGDANIKGIRIPASVSFIGEEAFAGCDSLKSIDVDPANKYYSSVDGVLFNKDRTELIWCPKRTGNTYEVPGTVTRIKEGAFGESGVENIMVRNEKVILEKYSLGYKYHSFLDGKPEKYEYNCVTLHCIEGSTAHKYAVDNLLDVNLIVPIAGVTLSQTQANLKKGDSITLTATISPDDTTDAKTLKWTSSDESVVRIEKETENGVEVTVVGDGTATITVTTVNGKAASCVIRTAQWIRDGKGWWYRRADGTYPRNGWEQIEDEWYYFNASGYCLENQWIGNYYVKSGGAMAKNQWVGNYYVGENGAYIATAGWLRLGETWYYLGAGGVRQTGWQAIGGAWYYFDGSGVMQTDWKAIGGTWYYFEESGAMVTGWKLIGKTWYYLNGSGAMLTGWQSIGGTWYYFNGSGAMLTGWQPIGGVWYYFNESGAMLTGWQTIDDTWYYFNGSGAMLASRWIGDYYVKASGAMATNEWIDSYWVGDDGKWIPNYHN